MGLQFVRSISLSVLMLFVISPSYSWGQLVPVEVQAEVADDEPFGGAEGDAADPFDGTKPESSVVDKTVANNPNLNKERIAELTAKIKNEPSNAKHYKARALEFVKGEAWKQAAADYVEVPKYQEGNSQMGQQIGVLFALAGDKDSLEILGKEMVQVYGQGRGSDDRERAAKTCVFTSNVAGDIKEIEKMAAKSLEENLQNEWVLHYYRTLALAQYRGKKYDEALKTIRTGESRDPSDTKMLDDVLMCHRAIEAMCLHQLKKTDEAKKVLAKAQAELAKHYEDEDVAYSTGFWHDWLSAKLLQKEAYALINKPAKSDAPQDESTAGTSDEGDVAAKPKTGATGEAKPAEKPKLDEKKIAELTAKIKSNPKSHTYYFQRALEYVKGEAWKEAAADFTEIPKYKKGDTQLGQQLCLLFALAGDKYSHEIVAEELLKTYGDKQAFQRERVAKACVLTPAIKYDIKKLEEMSADALQKNMTNRIVQHYYRTHALVLYRAKKYDEALKTLREAQTKDPEKFHMIPNVLMCLGAIETMCLHQLKKEDEAKKVFSKAKADLTEHYTTNKQVYMTGFWHDWLTAKLLHKEAEALLTKPTPN